MQYYLRDPEKIEAQVWDKIRELTILDRFSADEKQIVLYLVRSCGEPGLAERVRFSPNAVDSGKKAIKKYAYMLYDQETVRGAMNPKLLYQEPMCFINKALVISQAKSKKQTRAMTAVDQWKRYAAGSIAIFGESSTALCRLLELVQEGEMEKPALVIAMPSGFISTSMAKTTLMEGYEDLGLEYILITGNSGGSMFAAAAANALMSIQQGIYV